LLAFMYGLARDHDLMGRYRASGFAAGPYLIAIVVIAVCIAALGFASLP
jgi:hypothetical protein